MVLPLQQHSCRCLDVWKWAASREKGPNAFFFLNNKLLGYNCSSHCQEYRKTNRLQKFFLELKLWPFSCLKCIGCALNTPSLRGPFSTLDQIALELFAWGGSNKLTIAQQDLSPYAWTLSFSAFKLSWRKARQKLDLDSSKYISFLRHSKDRPTFVAKKLEVGEIKLVRFV